MKKYLKKSIIFFLSLIVILFSFIMPKLLFEAEDFAKEKEIYAKEKVKSKIDVEAEKIYLVKAIHEIYDNLMITPSGKEAVYYYDKDDYKKVIDIEKNEYKKISLAEGYEDLFKSSEEAQKINDEIKKLENNNILNEVSFNNNTKYLIKHYGTNYSMLRNNELIKSIDVIWEDYDINIEVENKTGKIIMISFPKDKIKDDVEIKEILENYIKYLDLYILGDWDFRNQLTETQVKFDYLVSEKSQLLAIILESNTEYIMSIQTIDRYNNLFAEIEKYNLDTK